MSAANSGLLSFQKMHGLGNDFIMLKEAPDVDEDNRSALIKRLCDRHFGIGADGIIWPEAPTQPDEFDIQFVYYNSDGSRAEMCGNGIRCFAEYLKTNHLLPDDSFTRPLRVETPAGLIEPMVHADGSVTVNMGKPILEPSRIPFQADWLVAFPVKEVPVSVMGQLVQLTPVGMGNPHAVIFMEAGHEFDPVLFGPVLETHSSFPAKTNVEFVTVHNPSHVSVTVWERGCGFTLACGTGACAVVVAGVLTGRTTRKVTVTLPGGDLLIEWPDCVEGPVLMTGPATLSFEGSISLS